jgi:hypothetical protein
LIERVSPLFISTGNAEAATGQSWRWCKNMAALLNVPVLGAGKKQLIDAAKFRDALERLAEPVTPKTDAPEDAASALRTAAGLRLVGGR